MAMRPSPSTTPRPRRARTAEPPPAPPSAAPPSAAPPPLVPPERRPGLEAVLERGRAAGLLGPGDVSRHIAHAEHFARLIAPAAALGPLLDLGSGGGLPGLVVAEALPAAAIDLLDGRTQRAAFLRDAVSQLALDERVGVLEERAEDAGRGHHRGRYAGVMARGFGAPAVTAECAAPVLRPGGVLVVSEPPRSSERWPAPGLALLGLRLRSRTTDPGFVVIEAVEPCPERFPRRVGVPAKRPLF